MTDFRYLGILLLLCSAGCGANQTSRALSYGENARNAYQNAFEAYEDEDCLTAEPLFQRIRREYPYSRFAALSELRLADCNLVQNNRIEAIRGYRAFIRHRPAHPDVPYANYKVAQAYYEQIPTSFFLSPPPEQRDQTPTRSALRYLQRYLEDYPEGEYHDEAQEMASQTLQILARHELYVADFYLTRDHPQSAVTRLRYLLSNYEGSGLEAEALLLLGRVYLRMEEVRNARQTFEELIERFPESGYAEQARLYLDRFES